MKAVLRGAELLVLDEPTSSLSPPEIAGLLTVLRRLREEGRPVIFISHKLGEVLEVCDEFVVLRDGEVARRAEVAGISRRDLAQMMVGRDVGAPIDRVVFFRSRRWQQKLRDGLGVALVLLLAGQAVIAVAWPTSLAPLDSTYHSAAEIWQVTGTVLLFGGIVLLVIAQLNLGASWRIGIEEGSSPGLVTSGFYRFCRNPIFFALLIMLIGYTLLLPTRLSLVLLVGAFIGIRQQVLTEESYLSRTYGDVYRAYARRVGRFVPGIGRLR